MEKTVDIVTFIQENWFAISTVITMIAFTWKVSHKMEAFKHKSDQNDIDLRKDLDSLKKDVTEQQEVIKADFQAGCKATQTQLEGSIRNLEARIDGSERKRIEGQERTRIIMDGVEATLMVLHEKGQNADVDQALENIRSYKSKKSAT